MAASANPSGNNQQESSRNGNGAAANDGGSAPHENSAVAATQAALRHNPGISVEWTTDEQSLLEELLTKYASERNIVRYAKIAMELKDKTVRDVALRCRWMNKKENGKRRKEDHSSTRKNKDKKEKVADPMAKSAPHATNRSSGPPYAQPVISMDSDDGISYKAIGGVTGELLEQNAHALEQISANFTAFKVHENINLFCQARNNILTILNERLPADVLWTFESFSEPYLAVSIIKMFIRCQCHHFCPVLQYLVILLSCPVSSSFFVLYIFCTCWNLCGITVGAKEV